MKQIRIAVVGAGPAGCFVVTELLKHPSVSGIDVLDRRDQPHGLVRYGVAPDHAHTRRVSVLFDRALADDRVQFRGGIMVGVDRTVDELRRAYDAVVFCTGAEDPRRLDVPGGELPGVTPALYFSRWVNGDWTDAGAFPLHARSVAVIGNGNVALDAARLLVQPEAVLKDSDIHPAALARLAGSSVRDVYIIGRRGPAQSSFGEAELRQLGEIPGCRVHIDLHELDLSEADRQEIADRHDDNLQLVQDALHDLESRTWPDAERNIHLLFRRSPVAVTGEGRVEGLELCRNRLEGPAGAQRVVPTDEIRHLATEWVITAIGHRSMPIRGLPFDEESGSIPNLHGRVRGCERVYVSGWLRRGARGLIGHNRKDAMEVVRAVMEDVLSDV